MVKRMRPGSNRKPHCPTRPYKGPISDRVDQKYDAPWLDLAVLQMTVPKIAPIPAVNAIASAHPEGNAQRGPAYLCSAGSRTDRAKQGKKNQRSNRNSRHQGG